MKHCGTKTLMTDRLILRPFRMEDAQAMYENWASDPAVTKYLRWPPHESVADSEMILSGWTRYYANDDFYQWAIVLRDGGDMPIGTISAVDSNEKTKMVHIGYCIGRNWWRQGITSEALAAVMDFFFREVEVNRLESQHDPNNPNSGSVMLKCGMRHEGTLRESDWNNQGICDAAMYAILAKNYFAVK